MLWTTPDAGLWKAQQHNIPCVFDQDLPTWHSVVVGYINCDLTFPGDKLKKISALAEVYRVRTKNIYVAGLWKENLIRDLCWWVVGPDTLGTKNTWLGRPVEYRAPSWSWAEIQVSKRHKFEFFPSNHAGSFEVHPDAVVRRVLLQQNPRNTTYGHISSGSLTVEGLTLTGSWSYNRGSLKLGRRFVTTSRDTLEQFWEEGLNASAVVTALILVRGKRTHYQ
jgi:hypothetical protein